MTHWYNFPLNVRNKLLKYQKTFPVSRKPCWKKSVGVILTGMGDDGAMGLSEMHDAGSLTMAQDEESCVVYGMPRKAVECGAVDEIKNLEGIVKRLIELR